MMKKLSNVKWDKFKAFGQEKPFQIETTSSSVDSIRLIDEEDKRIPYITRSDTNNGITKFVSSQNMSLGFDYGGCITVGLDTQTAFYQPHNFVTGQNIQVITGGCLSKDVAQFIIPLLKGQMRAKFNWGGNGATLGRMKALKLMLPVTVSGEPDYNYMTAYVQTQRKVLLEKYKAYAEQRIVELGDYSDVPSLVEKKWGPISLTSVFDVVRGKENNMAMLDDGDIPLVSARNTNNGVKGFVKTSKEIFEGNCITLNNDGDGGAGLAFYQPADMALDTHVTALVPKNNMSKWSMIFIAECVSCLHGFFGHGLSISNKRANIIKVMLPVNDIGEPDCEYMEQYTKNMMLRKYEQYLNYLDRTQKGV